MKRKGFVVYTSRDLGQYLRQNKRFLILLLTMAVGVGLGALFVRWQAREPWLGLGELFSGYLSSRGSQKISQTLSSSFLSSFLLVLSAFCSGLFVFGTPIALLISWFKGFGFGLCSVFLYATYGFQGFAFSALVLVPGAFLSCWAVLLGCREAFSFSAKLLGSFRASPTRWQPREELKRYAFRFSVILGILLFSSLIDGIAAAAFFRFFSF